ncbi:MAG: hypothetical protein EOP88_23950 [Verrucomicrobiaceae bacterium]|nr:MAG: hypothetical protein EOP88_23950 [Verrucomicrobiaceae bacterium]
MDTSLDTTVSDLDRDLSTEWIELSQSVRHLASRLETKAAGTILADDASQLSAETTRLCDHLERIHRDVETLLVELDEKLPVLDALPPNVDPDEVEREALQIHRETHELRADFKDIIKALFMWQDDPSARVKRHNQIPPHTD